MFDIQTELYIHPCCVGAGPTQHRNVSTTPSYQATNDHAAVVIIISSVVPILQLINSSDFFRVPQASATVNHITTKRRSTVENRNTYLLL